MTHTEKELEALECNAMESFNSLRLYFEKMVLDALETHDTKKQITLKRERDGLRLSVTPLDGVTFPYTVNSRQELQTFKDSFLDTFLNFRDELSTRECPIAETLGYVRDSVVKVVKELIEQANFIASIK